IGDKKIALRVGHRAEREAETCRGRRAAVAAEAGNAVARDCGDDAVGAEPTNAVVIPIADKERTVGGPREAYALTYLRARAGAAVAAEPAGARAGDGVDHPVQRDRADAEVGPVAEEHRA